MGQVVGSGRLECCGVIDIYRLNRRLLHWSVAGYPVVRIWLGTGDYQRLCEAAGPGAALWRIRPVHRLCGVPITVMDVGHSRIVFEDGASVAWERVV